MMNFKKWFIETGDLNAFGRDSRKGNDGPMWMPPMLPPSPKIDKLFGKETKHARNTTNPNIQMVMTKGKVSFVPHLSKIFAAPKRKIST